MSIAFLVTAFLVVISPGTGVIYTLSSALSGGGRAAIAAAFGCTLGIVPHLAMALLGLAAIFHTHPIAFEILRYLGIGYLLFMAWQVARETGVPLVAVGAARSALRRIVLRGVLINLLNPKLSIFFFAFLPQFVSPTADDGTADMLVMSGIFMAMTFVVFLLYGLFAAWFRGRVLERPRVVSWMRRLFAVAFVGLGVKLAVASR